MQTLPSTVDDLTARLGEHAYLADRGLATAIYLSLSLGKPLLLEGEAGVGKTEVAKVLSALLGRELIRLQCYEGIDASQALYEWNYSRQLIAVRAMDAAAAAEQAAEGTEPPADLNASADYKRHLARVLTRRALEAASQ